MKNFIRHTTAFAALIAIPAFTPLAHAQRASTSSCAWKPTDAWVMRQAEFFDDSKHDWSDDAFRTELLTAANLTAPLKAPVQLGVDVEGKTHTFGPNADAVREKLKQLAAVRGSAWPTRSVVGAAGVHAVYLITQQDTGLARAALHRMMEAGPAESPAADVATYEDHLRLIWGRKQIYGTQFKVDANGKVTLAPMEDSSHADLRREDAGLPPFALGLCLAKRK